MAAVASGASAGFERRSASVSQLMGLGLTMYEARIYLALVRRDSLTATEAARLGEVPRQRVYDVLEGLVEKGLVSIRPGRVAKYVATPPERALERLVACRREQLAASEDAAAALVALLRPAYEAGRRQTDPLPRIELLRGRRAVGDGFEELKRRVARELLVLAKSGDLASLGDDGAWQELARRRLARAVYELSVLERDQAAERIQRLIEAGQQARFVPELPLELAIIDAATVLFAIEDPVAAGSGLTTVVVEHAGLAGILALAFEAVWNRGLTFDQARAAAVARRRAGKASAREGR